MKPITHFCHFSPFNFQYSLPVVPPLPRSCPKIPNPPLGLPLLGCPPHPSRLGHWMLGYLPTGTPSSSYLDSNILCRFPYPVESLLSSCIPNTLCGSTTAQPASFPPDTWTYICSALLTDIRDELFRIERGWERGWTAQTLNLQVKELDALLFRFSSKFHVKKYQE